MSTLKPYAADNTGLLLTDDSANVKTFIANFLEQSKDSQIKASELYDYYRQVMLSSTSDVKLADYFDKFMSCKRISSGKVWLGYKIIHPYQWTGPLESEVRHRRLILNAAEELPVWRLGRAIRNLKISMVAKDPPLETLICTLKCKGKDGSNNGVGTGTMYLIRRDNVYYLPTGLWITEAVSSSLSLVFTVNDMPVGAGRLELDYDEADAPVVYQYTNTVRVDNDDYTYSVNGYYASIRAIQNTYMKTMITDTNGTEIPTGTEVSMTTAAGTSHLGYMLDTTDCLKALESLHKSNSNGNGNSNDNGKNKQYDFVSFKNYYKHPLCYLEFEPDGHTVTQSVEFNLVRNCDLVTDIKLVHCPVPSSLVTSSIRYGDHTDTCTDKTAICLCLCLSKNLQRVTIKFSTKYQVELSDVTLDNTVFKDAILVTTCNLFRDRTVAELYHHI